MNPVRDEVSCRADVFFLSFTESIVLHLKIQPDMRFSDWINSKIKKLNWTDLACIELASISFGLMLAALIPVLTEVSAWWYLAAWIVLALKPLGKLLG